VRYGSVCSGIEAATVAWHSLGWQPGWFSEIEKFPSAVLTHHYPTVPNYGDMTQHREWPNEPINLLVGGTPCQSFSVAGLRKGLDDPRGNLMLTYGAIARQYRPTWLVWENVPGVLSSNRGKDFGAFLGMLAELGYGFAYRILDAQYFGVAQRRRRVFVIGHLGNWQRAAAVLFERESLSGNPAPSREKGEETAKCLTAGVGKRYDPETETLPVAFDWQSGGDARGLDPKETAMLQRNQVPAVAQPINIYGGNKRPDRPEGGFYVRTDEPTSKTLDAASGLNPTCSQGGTAVMVAQPITQFGDVAGSLTARHDSSPCADRGQNVVAFAQNQRNEVRTMDIAGALAAERGAKQQTYLQTAMQVRRLTPVECERLQGFPDNYTNIPWRKSAESPDGPRYKALGNSMAVPVMHWIGKRISEVENA
jgi:DNA (cytosine-5)-methyltransferase 1